MLHMCTTEAQLFELHGFTDICWKDSWVPPTTVKIDLFLKLYNETKLTKAH